MVPGPMPGVAWMAAITARRRIATIRRAAWRDLRSTLTEKPSLAASFGTACVAEPLTVIVRSSAEAVAGDSSASARAVSKIGKRRFTEPKLPAGAEVSQAWGRSVRRPGVRTSWIGRRAELGTT